MLVCHSGEELSIDVWLSLLSLYIHCPTVTIIIPLIWFHSGIVFYSKYLILSYSIDEISTPSYYWYNTYFSQQVSCRENVLLFTRWCHKVIEPLCALLSPTRIHRPPLWNKQWSCRCFFMQWRSSDVILMKIQWRHPRIYITRHIYPCPELSRCFSLRHSKDRTTLSSSYRNDRINANKYLTKYLCR